MYAGAETVRSAYFQMERRTGKIFRRKTAVPVSATIRTAERENVLGGIYERRCYLMSEYGEILKKIINNIVNNMDKESVVKYWNRRAEK